MRLLVPARFLSTLLLIALAPILPAQAAGTGEAVDGSLFKATDGYIKSLLDKAGLSPRTMTDGDVAIEWHDGKDHYPGFATFDRNPDGSIWNLRLAALLPEEAIKGVADNLIAEFTNRWNRSEGLITLFRGEDGVLIAAANLPVEHGLNPAEFQASGIDRVRQTLGRILRQLDEFASSYRSSRQKADTSRLPARAVGLLELAGGGYCTASVVGKDVILTAAHCIFDSNGKMRKPTQFRAGYDGGTEIASARILDQFAPSDFDVTRAFISDGMEGLDWAFLRLDRPIGDKTGVLPIKLMSRAELGKMIGSPQYELVRVGYGSSKKLTMQTGCDLMHVWDDNTFAHLCYIEPGDSGSPELLRENDSYSIVGVDTAIVDIHDVKRANVAVSSAAFANALPDFLDRPVSDDMSDSGNPKNR